LMKGLASADPTTLELNFNQFVICAKAGFPRLVDKLKQLTVQVMESRTDMRTLRDASPD
jgi:anionic cell wall polymer biosynthesis LytR-Cps2A-Psr (LCP) family protein